MRLLLVLMATAFAYLMWRIVRVMSRTGGVRNDGGVFGNPPPPGETFSNVQDADFEELSPPGGKDDPAGPKQ